MLYRIHIVNLHLFPSFHAVLLLMPTHTNPTATVIWKVTPLFASWISSPSNFLFTTSLLSPSSTCIELGSGLSGVLALTLGPLISRYTATDQDYVLKHLRQNIAENLHVVFPPKGGVGVKKGAGKKGPGRKQESLRDGSNGKDEGRRRIEVQELDWETSDVRHLDPVDLIVACDCIYNESLIEPLNSTCAAICHLRQVSSSQSSPPPPSSSSSAAAAASTPPPTLCLIAQQLRSPDVFEAWLKSFHRLFHVWKVPDSMLDEGLREGSGFVVHVGVVR